LFLCTTQPTAPHLNSSRSSVSTERIET
jgi:hypothetical protein